MPHSAITPPISGPSNRLTIRRAASAADYEHVSALFREYVQSLGFELTFQDFEREIGALPSEYGPPDGSAWIAFAGSSPAGAVGLRRFDERSGEMKRLFVRPPFRGRGIGRALALTLIDTARSLGYERVLLDTIDSMKEAIALYRSLDFVQIAAYRHNPLPGAAYFERALSRR